MMVKNMAKIDSSIVTGQRHAISSRIDVRPRIDLPKSRCRIPHSHFTYASGAGSSNPSSASTFARS